MLSLTTDASFLLFHCLKKKIRLCAKYKLTTIIYNITPSFLSLKWIYGFSWSRKSFNVNYEFQLKVFFFMQHIIYTGARM